MACGKPYGARNNLPRGVGVLDSEEETGNFLDKNQIGDLDVMSFRVVNEFRTARPVTQVEPDDGSKFVFVSR